MNLADMNKHTHDCPWKLWFDYQTLKESAIFHIALAYATLYAQDKKQPSSC